MFAIDPRLKTATELFHGGRFAESIALCEALPADEAAATGPVLAPLLGELRLLQNRVTETRPLLEQAMDASPDSPRLAGLLAETHRRAGRLTEAAALYRKLGRGALAAKCEAAAGGGWYRHEAPAEPVAVPFVEGTSVAVIEAAAGGHRGRFVLDTGVGETLLDPRVAGAAGVTGFGAESIHFPAGPAGRIEQGLLPRLSIGPLAIDAVPVHVHDTREAMAGLLPFPVDGVIGTGLFSRLPTALDHGRRELRLGGPGLSPSAGGSPFYWAADQYPLLPARVNDRLDTLLFLDTGMAGAAVGLPLSTAQAAGVAIAAGAAGIGYGVQHRLEARALHCARIQAAGTERQDLAGMLLQPFRLERRFGFRIGGLLGDGFIGRGCLQLDFGSMRVLLQG